MAINGSHEFTSLNLSKAALIDQLNITNVLGLESIIGASESSSLLIPLNVQTSHDDQVPSGVTVFVTGYGIESVSLNDSGLWFFENIDSLSSLRLHGRGSSAEFNNITEVGTLELEDIYVGAIRFTKPLFVGTAILSNISSSDYDDLSEFNHLDDDDYYRGACD